MHLAGLTLLQISEVSRSAKFHEKMKGLGGFLWCVGDGWIEKEAVNMEEITAAV